MLGRADPRKLQDVGGIDGAGGEDHFTLGSRALDRSRPLVFDRDGTVAIKNDVVALGVDNHLEVGTFHRGPQIGARGAGSPAPAACLLAPADAVAGGGWQIVYVLAVFETDLLTSLDHRRAERRSV